MPISPFTSRKAEVYGRAIVRITVEKPGTKRQSLKTHFDDLVGEQGAPAGAIVETVNNGYGVSYHVIREGRRIDLSPKQAARRLVDGALGRGHSSSSVVAQLGTDALVRREIEQLAGDVLREGTNGTRIAVSFEIENLDATSFQERVGEYKGAFKGWAKRGTVHTISCDPDEVRHAHSLLRTLLVGDMLALRVVPVSGEAGILAVHGARQGRSGAEIGTVHVAIDPSDLEELLVSKTERGVRTLHGGKLKQIAEEKRQAAIEAEEAEARRREEIRREQFMERLREEAEAAKDEDAAAFVGFSI